MAQQQVHGPGRPPSRLDAVVGFRLKDDEQVPVTVVDRIEETIRWGGFVKDAAARVGITTKTLNDWRTLGNRRLRDILEGERRRSELTRHEKLCADLAARMDSAEAEARTMLLGIGHKVAKGGFRRTETTHKKDSQGQVIETTERVIEAPPDASFVAWLLSHRWPGDFGGRSRVEVSGPDGGPVAIDAEPVVERLRAALDEARANKSQSSPEALDAALARPANGHTGNGTDANT